MRRGRMTGSGFFQFDIANIATFIQLFTLRLSTLTEFPRRCAEPVRHDAQLEAK